MSSQHRLKDVISLIEFQTVSDYHLNREEKMLHVLESHKP